MMTFYLLDTAIEESFDEYDTPLYMLMVAILVFTVAWDETLELVKTFALPIFYKRDLEMWVALTMEEKCLLGSRNLPVG